MRFQSHGTQEALVVQALVNNVGWASSSVTVVGGCPIPRFHPPERVLAAGVGQQSGRGWAGTELKCCHRMASTEAGSGQGLASRVGLAAERLRAAALALRASVRSRSDVVVGGRSRVEGRWAGGTASGLLEAAAEDIELAGVVPARALGLEAEAAATEAAEGRLELAGVVPARALWRLAVAEAGLGVASASEQGGAHWGIEGICCQWCSGIGRLRKGALVIGC